MIRSNMTRSTPVRFDPVRYNRVRYNPVRSLVLKSLVSIVGLLCSAVSMGEPAATEAAWVKTSRSAAADFSASLRAKLQAGLQQGPVVAIEVCHREAPAIAAEVGAKYGLRLRRTSVRVRNTDNAPNASDQLILERLAARLGAGESAAQVEFIDDRGDAGTTLAKPLVTDALCLVCHGKSISPEVSAAIRVRYPQDEATGFSLGELRGALLVERLP